MEQWISNHRESYSSAPAGSQSLENLHVLNVRPPVTGCIYVCSANYHREPTKKITIPYGTQNYHPEKHVSAFKAQCCIHTVSNYSFNV